MTRWIAAVGVIAAVPAAWWIAGVFAGTTDESADPDYMWQPIGLSDSAATVIGVTSTLVVITASAVIVRGLRSGSIPTRWLGVVVPLALAAAYSGTTYAVATAPVVGANIGGGILVLFGLPIVPALLVVAGATAYSMRYDRRPRLG